MEISKYQVVGLDGDATDAYLFDDYQEAQSAAVSMAARAGEPMAVIEYTFEYTDSELVWNTEGADRWPPEDVKGDDE